MSHFGKDNARSAHLYEVYQGKSVLIIVLHRDAGTSRYSFIWASPLAWLNSLSLVNNDGYYLTTAQKTKDNVFFNGTNVYPISFALAGAGMIAYAGEQPEKDFIFTLLHFCNTTGKNTPLLTAHPHTTFKRCGTVDCELGGMKMMKQPHHPHHRGLFRIQWGGMWDLVISNLNGSFTIMLSIKAQNKNTCSACLALVWTY